MWLIRGIRFFCFLFSPDSFGFLLPFRLGFFLLFLDVAFAFAFVSVRDFVVFFSRGHRGELAQSHRRVNLGFQCAPSSARQPPRQMKEGSSRREPAQPWRARSPPTRPTCGVCWPSCR